MTENFIQATPFFTVRSIADSVAFYCDRLGFAVYVQDKAYAYLGRGKVGIRLLIHSAEDRDIAPGTAYIDVRDVDSIFRDHGASWADLPDGAVHGPIDQNYNQRELFIRDP